MALDDQELETISTDKLEELFALPSNETEIKPEWIEACAVTKGMNIKELGSGTPCPNPAVVNITLLCPFCGPGTYGLCETDMGQAIRGELFCAPCSNKGGTKIFTKPVSCLWKSDE